MRIRTLHEVKIAYVERVIKKCDGNKTNAAKALGISLRGLRYMLNKKQNGPS